MAYYRLDQLVDMLAVFSPTDQNYLDKMRKLINVDVLIIDDFMTMSINQRGQEDLSKIIFDRDGRLPTLISSQSAAAYWVEALPDRGPDPRKVDTSGVSYAAWVSVAELSASKVSGARRLHQECRLRVL